MPGSPWVRFSVLIEPLDPPALLLFGEIVPGWLACTPTLVVLLKTGWSSQSQHREHWLGVSHSPIAPLTGAIAANLSDLVSCFRRQRRPALHATRSTRSAPTSPSAFPFRRR